MTAFLWGPRPGRVRAIAGAAGIRGDYVEARTADVFTGPCFSNAEIFIYGNQAVMAWKVTEGSFDGVDLSGLSVAAAVQGTTTFSEDEPEQARAVLIVDEKADARAARGAGRAGQVARRRSAVDTSSTSRRRGSA